MAAVLLVCILVLGTLDVTEEEEVNLQKCCDVYQMLDSSGRKCVDSPWPHNASFLRDFLGRIEAPIDTDWLQRWLPPGMPLQHPEFNFFVEVSQLRFIFDTFLVVNSSSMWKEKKALDNNWQKKMVVSDVYTILRPRLSGGMRKARYCVDAALAPSSPFVLAFRTICSDDEDCFSKCCSRHSLLVRNGDSGITYCEENNNWRWSSSNSSLVFRDPETPYVESITMFSNKFHTSEATAQTQVQILLEGSGESLFSTWKESCVDFERLTDGRVREVIGYDLYWRVARGLYWVSRNFSFVSVMLLVAALASVACSPRVRSTVHGKALACHAASLLLFNLGQLLYYLGISETVDTLAFAMGWTGPRYKASTELLSFCKYLAYAMYFQQIAAALWLTAVCVNMAVGFRRRRVVLPGRSRKTFLMISTVAWGMTILLTTACVVLFKRTSWRNDNPEWYSPTFVETRTCFSEVVFSVCPQEKRINKRMIIAPPCDRSTMRSFRIPGRPGCDPRRRRRPSTRIDRPCFTYSSSKYGALLFYYGPISALVIANIVSLFITARQVHYLSRGNSLLKREERAQGGGVRQKDEKRSSLDPQSITVYLKLLLSAGVLEVVIEIIAWSITWFDHAKHQDAYTFEDHTFVYRTAGYCADLLRAVIVLWLCAPERGALSAVWRKLRPGEKEDTKLRKYSYRRQTPSPVTAQSSI